MIDYYSAMYILVYCGRRNCGIDNKEHNGVDGGADEGGAAAGKGNEGSLPCLRLHFMLLSFLIVSRSN